LCSHARTTTISFERETDSMSRVLPPLLRLKRFFLEVHHPRFVRWTSPLTRSLPLGTLLDLGRSKSELIAENALLRQQLIMPSRQVKQPACNKVDRTLLVLLARLISTGSRPSSSFNQTHCCVGIVSFFAWSGSTSLRPLLISRGYPQKPSP
jgi:hypothetical protein